MSRTNVVRVVVVSLILMTSFPPEVGGRSRDCCWRGGGWWSGRETTWQGADTATYRYVVPGDIQLGVILSIQQQDERRPCGIQLRDTGVVQLVEAVVYAVRYKMQIETIL